jgi:hypothetical protein
MAVISTGFKSSGKADHSFGCRRRREYPARHPTIRTSRSRVKPSSLPGGTRCHVPTGQRPATEPCRIPRVPRPPAARGGHGHRLLRLRSAVRSASSSRSQVSADTTSGAARVACGRPSVGICRRPPLAVTIVTHFVTQSSCERGRLLAW